MSKIATRLFIEIGIDNGGNLHDPPDNNHCWERAKEYIGLNIGPIALEIQIISNLRRLQPWIQDLPELPELPSEPELPIIPDPLNPPENFPPPIYLKPPFDILFPRLPGDFFLVAYVPSLWTKDSNYFFHYEGMNQGGCIFQDPNNANGRPIRYNGMVQLPPILYHEITVQATQDKITHMWVADSGSSGNYTIIPHPGGGPWRILVSNQFDPVTDDHVYVWGKAVGGGGTHPEVMCDPIIRNRN